MNYLDGIQYANQVAKGEIEVCRNVRLACQRFLNQYENKECEWEFDKQKNVSQVGIRLMKFCAKYDLVKVSEQAQSYSDPLNARYHK